MMIDIDSIVRKLLIKYPSFGSVIANLKFQASEDIITAGTDGKVIFYNPKFVSVLSDQEKTFLFAHEVCHIVFEHMYRREGKDKICWSIATDAVINALLKQDGLPLIKGGVDIPEAANYDAEEMYDKLLKEKKKQQEQQSQQDNAGQPNSQGNEGQQNPQSSGGQQQGQQNSQMQQSSQGGKGQQNTQDGQGQQNLQGNERQQSQQNSQRQESSQVGQGQQQNMKEKTEKQSDVVIDSHELWDNKIKERKKEELEKNQGQQNSQGNEGQQNPQSSGEQQGQQNSQMQQNSQGGKGQQNTQDGQEQQNSQGNERQQSQQNSQRQESSQVGQGQQQNMKEKTEKQSDVVIDSHELWDNKIKERKKEELEKNQGQQNSQGNEGQQNPQSSGEQQGQQNSQMQQNSQGGKGQQNTQDGQEQQNSQGNERQQSQQNSQRQESSQVGQGQQQNMKEKTEKQSDVVIDSHELWDNKIKERKKEELEKNQGQQNSQGNEGQPNPQSSEEQQNSNGSKGQQGLQKQQEQQNSPSSTRKKSSQTGQGQQQKIKEKIEEQEDIGHDTHSLWDKAIKERQKTEKFVEKGEKETFKQNRIERRKQLQELSKELVKEATCGTEIQRQKEKLPDIGIGTPLIDWRRALRQAIKHNEEWTRKNARMRNGYFRYRLEETPMPETEIILDTSGSVSEILLRNFLRECKNILIHSKIKVGCFNTEFHGFTELKRLEDIDNIRLPIGGGTDFDVAVNAFSRRVPNKIIFTDGLAPMPEKVVKNVIWIVYGNKEIHPKGGKVINVNDEQLKKLCHFVSKDKSEEISR